MKKAFVVLSLVLVCLCSSAQEVKEAKPYIEVTGSAESDIDPNIIVLSVRLKEFEENRVKVTLDKIEKDFLDAVTKAGIEKKDIVLADLTANAVWQKRRDREVFAQKTYQITFSKNEAVLKFLEASKDVKIDNLDIVKLSHTEIAKLRLDIKVEALKAAERKADVLLSAAGAKRGKALLIQEIPSQNFVPYANQLYAANAYMKNADMGFESADIQMRKINLQFEILIRYAIE